LEKDEAVRKIYREPEPELLNQFRARAGKPPKNGSEEPEAGPF
jgi:hypothetical protein